MAAHALTIAKQILDMSNRSKRAPNWTVEKVVDYAISALDAPGLDGFSYPCLRLEPQNVDTAEIPNNHNLYSRLYCACRGLLDEEGNLDYGLTDENKIPVNSRLSSILLACGNITRHCSHLQNYRTLEAAQSAYMLFVKPKTPYWRKRSKIWDEFPWDATNYPQPEDCYL